MVGWKSTRRKAPSIHEVKGKNVVKVAHMNFAGILSNSPFKGSNGFLLLLISYYYYSSSSSSFSLASPSSFTHRHDAGFLFYPGLSQPSHEFAIVVSAKLHLLHLKYTSNYFNFVHHINTYLTFILLIVLIILFNYNYTCNYCDNNLNFAIRVLI